jgi:hypothetical protein
LKEDFFMFIKKFFVVMAVLLSVSLIVIGCEGPAGADGTNGNDSTVPGDKGDTGDPGDPAAVTLKDGDYTVAALNEQIADLRKGSGKLILSDVAVTGAGKVDFAGVDVTIAGKLGTRAATSNTGPVYLVFAGAKSVTFDEGRIVFDPTYPDQVIATKAQKAAWSSYEVPNLYYLLSTEADELATASGAIALYELKLGDPLPDDADVFVYGPLTVTATSEAPLVTSGTKVIAIGTVELAGNNATALASPYVDIDRAEVFVKDGGAVEITLPATVRGTRFYLKGEQDVIKVSGVTNLTAHVRGNGELALVGTVNTSVTTAITGGGRVVFDHTTSTGTGALVALSGGSSIQADVIVFKRGVKLPDSGTVTLEGSVGLPLDAAIEFTTTSPGTLTLVDGSVIFTAVEGDYLKYDPALVKPLLRTHGNNLSLSATAGATVGKLSVKAAGLEVSGQAVSFSDAVDFESTLRLEGAGVSFADATTFAAGTGLSMKDATSTVTLKGNNAWLGNPYSTATALARSKILSAPSGDVLLTPTAETKLEFSADRNIKQSSTDGAGAGAHSITIATTAATLAAGATYTVASEASKVGTLSLGVDLNLSAADPGANLDAAKLVLTGASATSGALLKGTGKVVAGVAGITGGTNGWQAVTAADATGTVTISKDTIVSSATTALTAQDASADIGVTAASATANTLSLTGAIALASSKGKVTLTGDGTNSAVLKLIRSRTNPGKLEVATGGSVVSTFGTSTNKLNASGTSGNNDATITKKDAAGTDVTVTSADVVVYAGAATVVGTAATLNSIAAVEGGDVHITGSATVANKAEIANGWKVLGTNTP